MISKRRLPSAAPWSVIDQGLSSGSNFCFTVIAARELGPGGLGAVIVGLMLFQTTVGFQRALVTDPLVARWPRLGAARRRWAAGSAVTLVAGLASLSAINACVVGSVAGGGFGHVLFMMAPWLPAAVLQDYWRVALFRDGRVRAAALNDGVWLLTMAAVAPAVLPSRGVTATVAVWGSGALISAAVGAFQVGFRPVGVRSALRWWKKDAADLGRWLGLDSIVYIVGTYATTFALAALLGGTSYGGLRAVQSLFSPLTLLLPAVGLAGLPAISRALLDSDAAARALTLRVSAAVCACTSVYVALLVIRPDIVALAFGDRFAGFRAIVIPVGLSQVAAAVASGAPVLLKAQGRGRALAVARGTAAAVAIICAIGPALTQSLLAVAWGSFASATLSSLVLVVVALRRSQGSRGLSRTYGLVS